MIARRVWLIAGLAGLLPGRLIRAAESSPLAPVDALDAGLEEISKAGRATPFAQRMATLMPVVQRAFALETILRASVGPRFAAIPANQQASLLEVFSQYTVASYVANFDSDSGLRFEVSPQTRPVDSDQVVTTQIVPRNGSPTRLDYVVRQGAAGWQIVDVLFDGSISQVAVQRSDFRSLLASGSAEPLIESLRRKIVSMTAGGKA